jgi:AcrR family transcriptional regulator
MELAAQARRLPPEERREQLVQTALSVAARQGIDGLSCDAVANQAGVTRNLVYHYFPGGRRELLVAAVHRAGEDLTGDWVTDPDVPLPERMEANLERMMDHASRPTDAWLLYRQRRASTDPELLEIADRYAERLVSNVALNNLGTEDPSPVVRTALEGFFGYAESALDAAARQGLPRAKLSELIRGTLLCVVETATRVDGDGGRG